MILDAFAIVSEAVIVLSTLLPNGNQNDDVNLINDGNRALARKLYHEGSHVVLAEMNDGFIPMPDIWDGTHPQPDGPAQDGGRMARGHRVRGEGPAEAPSTDVEYVN